tara:strand:- start:33199 stop:33783 length:585 start_codon:yes stop_codon:yes gene_type:complete
MRKQTLILTTWLALPFICLTLIMVWIFVSLDKDRLMNEPPVGAGAGDTGNANALGQYLAGRDPDEVSKANQARREHSKVEPFNWPGGTLITFEFTPNTQLDQSLLEARITIESQDKVTVFVRHPQPIDGTKWGVQLDQFGPSVDEAHIAVGYRTEDAQPAEWDQTPIPLTLIIAGEVLSSDPIEIPMRITIVTP